MILRCGKTKESRQEDKSQNLESEEEPGAQEELLPVAAMAENQDDPPGDPPINGRFAIKRIVHSWPKDKEEDPAANPKKQKSPPPIVVPADVNKKPVEKPLYDHIKAAFKGNLPQGTYSIKLGKNANLIQLTDTETHNKAQNILRDNKFHFYSYPNPEETIKKSKFVIYGLGDVEIAELQDDLTSYGVQALDIKKMSMKNPKYPGHCNYLVYYDRDDRLTLQTLQRAKYLCNTAVKWAHYYEPADRITQCTKCWRYGHAEKACHLPTTCMMCAGTHKTTDCPLLAIKASSGSKSVPAERLKCINCKEKHTAIYKECPKRLAYTLKKAQPTYQPKTTTYTNAPPPTTNPWNQLKEILIEKQLAELQPPVRTTEPPTVNNTKPPPPPTRPRTPGKTTETQPQQPIQLAMPKVTYNETLATNDSKSRNQQSNDNDLFSPQELMVIFRDVISSISQCQNKQEQLAVIFEIALRYTPCQV